MKFIFLFISLSFLLFSQNKDEIILEVGKEKISWNTVEKAYSKNLNKDSKKFKELSYDSIVNFVNLYSKYRLKVLDAIDRGYLQDSAVIKEINSNKKILAESYYYENQLMKPKIDQIINKRMFDIKFAFVIMPFSTDDPNSVKITKQKADSALKLLKSGISFDEVAKNFSADQKTAENGGVVDNWVTGGVVQSMIEEVLYSLKPGEFYPKVLETSYGCFLIKLVDKQPRNYVKASQIYIGFNNNSPDDSTIADKKADSLMALIKSGFDFNKLATDFTSDSAIKANEGRFSSWYSRSTGFDETGSPLIKEVEEALYKLKVGQVSEKVTTEFGIHILKADSIKPVKYEEEYTEAKDIYKKLFFNNDKKQLQDSLAYKFGLNIFEENLQKIVSSLDTNKTTVSTTWADSIPKDMFSLTLFSFNKKNYDLNEFILNTQTKRELKGFTLTVDGIKAAISKMVEGDAFDLATVNLEDKFPEYKNLLKEFKDGIILFKVEEEEVWSKRVFDTLRAKQIWEPKKANYFTNYRYEINEIFLLNENSANETLKEIQNGADFEKTAELKTQREGYREKKGYHGWVERTKDKIADIIVPENLQKGKVLGPLKYKSGFSIIKINDFEKPRQMTFEEAIPMISPEVQNMLQEELRTNWLENVKKKHPVKIYDAKIKSMIK